MKNSIRFKLIIWITGTLFIILSSSSFYLFQEKREYEFNHYQENKASLKKQLKISLINGFWQLDKKYISSVIESNMQNEYILAIKAKDQSNLYVGILKTKESALVTLDEQTTPTHSDKLEIRFSHEKLEIGFVEIFFSRQPFLTRIDEFLLRLLFIEFIAIFSIGSMLYFAMNRYIFAPIQTLEFALEKANELDIESNDNKQDYGLPKLDFFEWSKLVNGVNTIINKISQELHNRQFAEIDALLEKNNAEIAYNELIKTKNSLVQTEKMAALGRLVAGIAHEVNTPLGITLTVASQLKGESIKLASMVEEGSLKKSQLVEFMDLACESSRLIFSNSKRASELIQSFKQIAVDQSSQIKRTFFLCEYLKEVLHSLNPKIKATSIDIKFHCSEIINMNSYPGALSQVITNLVLNAIIHAYDEKQKGTVSISAFMLDQNVEIKVTDNGYGIKQELLGKIFDPFFTTKQGQGGTGLGLNIAFNIVTQTLKGTISVTSEVNKGSCFTINIPIEQDDNTDSVNFK